MLPSRPASVTLLLWVVLLFSAWGAVRLVAALRWWDVLYEFEARLRPLYLSMNGIIWCVVGGVFFWAVITRRRWLRPALLFAAILWYCQYWVERIFFQAQRANTVFVAIVTTLLLAVIATCIFLPSTKTYFTRIEEHEQADQSSETT